MCGNQLKEGGVEGVAMTMDCPACGRTVNIPVEVYEKLES
jgi:hypothetical protein